MTSKELAKIAYNALDDKKGVNITIIDISEISIIADYFIIAGGTNENQLRHWQAMLKMNLQRPGLSPKHVEGYTNANWILIDYEDVIVHVFNEDDRLFYDLERIWRDGKIVNVEEL